MENRIKLELPIHLSTDFFEVTLADNTLDVVCEESHLINIYNYLYQEGFRILDINDRMELYRKEEGLITTQSIDSMLQYLFDKLKSLELFDKALLLDIWDYFEEIACFQKDLLMEHCLYPKTAGAKDKHQFLLRYDKLYRTSFQNDWMTNLFVKHDFEEVQAGGEEEKFPLYYKKISDESYLIFTVQRSEYACTGMMSYDSWLSSKKPKKLKTLEPQKEVSFKELKLNFDPLSDWDLIEPYLNN